MADPSRPMDCHGFTKNVSFNVKLDKKFPSNMRLSRPLGWLKIGKCQFSNGPLHFPMSRGCMNHYAKFMAPTPSILGRSRIWKTAKSLKNWQNFWYSIKTHREAWLNAKRISAFRWLGDENTSENCLKLVHFENYHPLDMGRCNGPLENSHFPI